MARKTMKRRSKTSGVIAVATMKGGSGKTTLAVCLAARWMQRRLKTALIDADPQRSALRWVRSGEALKGLRTIAFDKPTGADFQGQVRALQDEGFRRIIVDTPGFRSPVTAPVLQHVQVALMPLRASPVDYEVAADTIDMIKQIAEGRARQAPLISRFVLTQTTQRSVVARHIRTELIEAGYPLLDAELGNRVVHAEAPFTGSTPSLIEPDGAAAAEIEALREELDALLP